MTNQTANCLAGIGFALIGAAYMLARPDKAIELLRGSGWDDDKVPASWYADQREAERVAAIWAARREATNG